MANSSTNVARNLSGLPNGTEECDIYGAPGSVNQQALMTMGYAILLTLSLTGNVLVIAVFYKRYHQLRTPVNYFIANMAVSDLFVPIFVLPQSIKQIYLGWDGSLIGGVFGDVLCRVVNLADEVTVTVSSQSMVFIAAERCWSIVFPRKLPLITRRTTPRYICFTWVFSFVFFSYYLFAYKLKDKNGSPLCVYNLPEMFDSWQDLWRADRLSLLVTFVAIPFILTTIFYSVIIVTLRRQGKFAILHLSSEQQQLRMAQNKRITGMFLTIVVFFFISWTPYYIHFFHQYYSLGLKWSCNSKRLLSLSAKYISYLYTAINPLIYYLFNPTYREGFHELLCCPCSCFHDFRQRRRSMPLRRRHSLRNSNLNADYLNSSPNVENMRGVVELQIQVSTESESRIDKKTRITNDENMRDVVKLQMQVSSQSKK